MKFMQKKPPFLIILLFLFLSNSILSAQEYTLLKNAKIYTLGEKGVIKNGMILIKGKKIERVGQDLEVPSRAQILDLSGKIVIPGMVCASSALYLHEKDRAFAGDESPDTNVLDGINYLCRYAPLVLRHGVTSAYISPVSYRSIGGLGAVVKLRLNSKGSLQVLRGEAALRLRMERLQDKKTSNLLRLSQYYRLRDKFIQAQEYGKEWKKYREKLKEFKESKEKEGMKKEDKAQKEKAKMNKKKPQEPKKPKRDEGKEILLQAMDKKIPVRIEAHRPDAILNALKLAKEFGLMLILERCEEWPAVMTPLKEASVPILTNPLLDYKKFILPGGAEGYAATLLKINSDEFFYSDTKSVDKKSRAHKDWKSLVQSNTPLVLIPPDSFPLSARYMRHYASLLVAGGLSVEEALKTLTITAAQVLGVSDRVGSLEAGKDADIVVLNGEPLSSLSKIEKVFINGSLVRER